MTAPAQDCDAAEAAVRRFESYLPPAGRPADAVWPPAVRPARWNGARRAVMQDAIHYDRAEIVTALRRLETRGLRGGRALVSDYYAGLTTLLWGEWFDETFSLSVRPSQKPEETDGRFAVLFARPDDMPSLYRAAARIDRLDALIIDGSARYDETMILYYVFRPLVRSGGGVLFFNAAPKGDPANGVPALLDGLRSGELDGVRHEIEDWPSPGGLGLAWETLR